MILPALMVSFLFAAPARADHAADAVELLNRARERQRTGSGQEALHLYLDALGRFRRLEDDASAAICLNNASVILLDGGQPERALAMAREAVGLRRALGDHHLAGRSLTNSGRALQALGRLEEAEADFLRALEAAREARDRRDIVINELNLGVVRQAQGLYGRALAAIRRAFEVIDESSGEAWAGQQRLIALNNRGALYERIGEYRLALADYEAILGMTSGGLESVPFLINSATILRNLGDPDLALARLEQAERVLDAAGDDLRLHANLLSNVGLTLHRSLRRPAAARPVLERAWGMARAVGDREEAMTIGNYLGAVDLDLGRLEQAARIYGRILDDIPPSSTPEQAWETHLGMARVLERQGDSDGALRALLTAAAMVEGARLDLAAEMAPRRFMADRLDVYASLSEALAAEGDSESNRAGLRAVERARERLLLSGWRRLHRSASAAAPGGGEAAHLLADLSASAARLYGAEDPQEIAAWRDLQGRWERRSRARLPEGAPMGEALVEYLIVGERSRVYWLADSEAGTRTLPGEARIDRLAEDWLEAILGARPREEHEVDLGLRLCEAVLHPVLAALPPGTQRLRIVPDGALWRVPIDALPCGRLTAGASGRLLDQYEITLAPLLSLGEPETPPAAARARPSILYAFFGPPTLETGIPPGPARSFPAALAPLPEARLELEAVRRALGDGGVRFLDREVRESAFRDLAGRNLGVLHLATHALVDPLDVGRTGIVLSLGSRGEEAALGRDDGFLSLPEILALDLAADLTFLSACSGAVGDRLPGEGLDSLAAALLESGSGAVVASLWDVEDLPTRVLVEQFYDRLGRGRTFAAALREAKLALLGAGGEIARPRHWAAWMLIGEGRRTAATQGTGAAAIRPLVAAMALLLAAVLYAARRRRLSRRS